ncbi:MAG: hypothetical protein EBX55_08805 [Betaproteobacteria bacterium]|nr:hypothetical protein [Betaproteobacteria bacterium]NDG58554.1 hypothetical protein [Betaproteobacteria bacterium]
MLVKLGQPKAHEMADSESMQKDSADSFVDPASKRFVIAMLGGECTGKTALAQSLAGELGLPYLAEVLRDFVDQHQRAPRHSEQADVLRLQCQQIEAALARLRPLASGPLLICDASPWMTAIYSLQYFNDPEQFAQAQAMMLRLAKHYRFRWLHFHCADDIAWQADGLQREGPEHRARSRAIVEQYPPLADHQEHAQLALLSGPLQDRLRDAGAALDAQAGRAKRRTV